MARKGKTGGLIKAAIGPGLALVVLLAIAGYAVLGPTGVLAWGEYRAALDNRSKELAKLEEQRAALKNRVELLDPAGADPDLVGELLRKKGNFVHPDEIIVPLK